MNNDNLPSPRILENTQSLVETKGIYWNPQDLSHTYTIMIQNTTAIASWDIYSYPFVDFSHS